MARKRRAQRRACPASAGHVALLASGLLLLTGLSSAGAQVLGVTGKVLGAGGGAVLGGGGAAPQEPGKEAWDPAWGVWDDMLAPGTSFGHRQLIAAQVRGLMLLKLHMDKKNALGWDVSKSLGTGYCKGAFFGVECDQYGMVTKIGTGGRSLGGSLPLHKHVAGLVELKWFQVTNGDLTGTLPGDWGNFTKMEEFSIDHSKGLTGTLPAEWANWRAAKRVYLFENSLSGTLPPEWGPGWSDSMELLALQSNGGITGPLPASWAEMAKLRDLRLFENKLEGTLPASWGRLKALDTLMIGVNSLQGTLPPEWGAMKAMRSMRIEHAHLRGTIPATWGRWRKVEELWLIGNPDLTGCFPGRLGKSVKILQEQATAFMTRLDREPCEEGEGAESGKPRRKAEAGDDDGGRIPDDALYVKESRGPVGKSHDEL